MAAKNDDNVSGWQLVEPLEPAADEQPLEPIEMPGLEVITSRADLATFDHQGDALYLLPPTVGPGAIVVTELLYQPGPLGAMARGVEELLTGISEGESRILLQATGSISLAMARILEAGSADPGPQNPL